MATQKKESMTIKEAEKYRKTSQVTLNKIEKFYKLSKQIKTLTNTLNTLEKDLIEEVLADKSLSKNKYYDIGKFFIGISQNEPSFATSKADLEKKLIEMGVDIEPLKKYGATPKATFKVEVTGRK